MTDNGGETVSMAGDAEERPPDSGAVPDASTELDAASLYYLGDEYAEVPDARPVGEWRKRWHEYLDRIHPELGRGAVENRGLKDGEEFC